MNLFTLAIMLTGALHLGALLMALAAPRLLPSKLSLPEVYEVKLYTAVELPPPPAPPRPMAAAAVEKPSRSTASVSTPPTRHQQPPAKTQAKPAEKSSAKPQAKPQAKPLIKTQAKPEEISLSPIKEQLRQEAKERELLVSQNRNLEKKLVMLKLDLQKQKADEQAQEAAKKARKALAEAIRTTQPRRPATVQTSIAKAKTDEPGSGSQVAPRYDPSSPPPKEVLTAYSARLKAHIGPHWFLPENQDWDKKLSATIVIRIKKDGTVTTPPWIDKSSGDTRFDSYVKKAVNKSLPLPPLPPELGKSSEEIGVTFTPGGLK